MRKLLKYDLKSVFRVWWISSAAMALLAVVGGFCLRVLTTGNLFEREDPAAVLLVFSCMATLGAVLVGITAYSLVVLFFSLRRYYCHLFTDEGYLTFTLPVSRNKIFLSKFLMCMIYKVATSLVILCSIGIVLAIGLTGVVSWVQINEFVGLWVDLWQALTVGEGVWTFLFSVETVLTVIASSLFSTLFAMLCITIGAVIARRQKVLAAIGIYYGGTTVLSVLMQVVFSVGMPVMMYSAEGLIDGTEATALSFPSVMLITGLIAAVVMLALAAVCYIVNLRLLKNRLNLS